LDKIIDLPKPFMMLNELTNQQNKVVDLLMLGKTNKDIAKDLFVTEKTVKFHITNIFKSLNVKNRNQLFLKITKIRGSYVSNLKPETIYNSEVSESIKRIEMKINKLLEK
jgi:DNA-binding CsgD family transcriptional regulator